MILEHGDFQSRARTAMAVLTPPRAGGITAGVGTSRRRPEMRSEDARGSEYSVREAAFPGLELFMNLPNALTLGRIFLVPLLVVVLLTKFEGRLIFGVRKELIGAAIFGIASFTDWLDGFLARRRKQVTVLGQMIDPIADKLLTSAAFISLVQMDLAPAWMVAVIIGREFAVTGLRSFAFAREVVIPASPLGKLKMIAQVIAILALILGQEEHLQPLGVVGYWALWVVVGPSLISAYDYYRRFSQMPSRMLSESPR